VRLGLDTLRNVAAQLPDYLDRVRSGEQAALPSAQFSRDEAKPIAGRAVLVVDQDPWALTAGEAAFVHLAVDVVTPVNNGTWASIDLIGQLTPQVGSPTGGATRAYRFTGQVSLTERNQAAQLHSVDVSGTVERSPIPGSGQDRYLVQGVTDVLQMLAFGGSPYAISASAAGNRDRLNLVADPSVADPNSELKQHADVALQLLRAARPNDTQFYERTQLATFGVARTDQTGLVADRDWVAFRRRPPTAPAAAAPPRTVRVFVHNARSAEEAQAAQKLLIGGSGDRLRWQRIAAVDFDAASGAMVTDAGTIRSGYAATGAGPSLAYVGYAPESMPAGTARAGAVLAALAPAVRPATGVEAQLLRRPPAGFVDASTDGSVFLIAETVQGTPLLQLALVEGARSNADTSALLKLLLTDQPHRPELDQASGHGAYVLGTVAFVDDQPDRQAMHELEATALTRTHGAPNHDPARFPVLWVDRDWAAQNGALAERVEQAADEMAAAIAQGHGEKEYRLRRVFGRMGTAPTPAVLIEVYERVSP
jgi:hypothetical protein